MEHDTYTIGALATAAGVPTTTLRYYERRGLLAPGARSRSKYRLYDRTSLERLRFIRAAQATGFTLEDIAGLLDLRDTDAAGRCCSEVGAMLTARLDDVERRIADLECVRAVLRAALKSCRASRGPCAVMAQLSRGEPLARA